MCDTAAAAKDQTRGAGRARNPQRDAPRRRQVPQQNPGEYIDINDDGPLPGVCCVRIRNILRGWPKLSPTHDDGTDGSLSAPVAVMPFAHEIG